MKDCALGPYHPFSFQIGCGFDGRILYHDVKGFRRTAVDAYNFYVRTVGSSQYGAGAAKAAGDVQRTRRQGFGLLGAGTDFRKCDLGSVFLKPLYDGLVRFIYNAGNVQGLLHVRDFKILQQSGRFLFRRFGRAAAAACKDGGQGEQCE